MILCFRFYWKRIVTLILARFKRSEHLELGEILYATIRLNSVLHFLKAFPEDQLCSVESERDLVVNPRLPIDEGVIYLGETDP